VGLAVGIETAGEVPSESGHGAATVQTLGVERTGCEAAAALADGWFRPMLSGADVLSATAIGISTNTPFISTSDVGCGFAFTAFSEASCAALTCSSALIRA